MKKTLITLICALAFGGASMYANTAIENTTSNNEITVVKDEINSFCKAIVKGDLDMVRKLIALGEDVNERSLGMTPAMFAARYNKAEILKVLILNGASLTAKSDNGISAEKYAKQANANEALAVIEAAKKK